MDDELMCESLMKWVSLSGCNADRLLFFYSVIVNFDWIFVIGRANLKNVTAKNVILAVGVDIIIILFFYRWTLSKELKLRIELSKNWRTELLFANV